MRIRNWASGIRVRASVGVAVMAASSWLGAAAEAQEESKRKVQRKERSWKLSVVSEAVPGKIGKKLTARIEGDTFVCRSSDVPLLEIPLKTVTEISRDDDKDLRGFPVADECGDTAFQRAPPLRQQGI